MHKTPIKQLRRTLPTLLSLGIPEDDNHTVTNTASIMEFCTVPNALHVLSNIDDQMPIRAFGLNCACEVRHMYKNMWCHEALNRTMLYVNGECESKDLVKLNQMAQHAADSLADKYAINVLAHDNDVWARWLAMRCAALAATPHVSRSTSMQWELLQSHAAAALTWQRKKTGQFAGAGLFDKDVLANQRKALIHILREW